jgi:hypothetical protein
MSRTIRRKNAWNKRDYIEDFIDWEWFQERIRHVKYHGLTDEQFIAESLLGIMVKLRLTGLAENK